MLHGGHPAGGHELVPPRAIKPRSPRRGLVIRSALHSMTVAALYDIHGNLHALDAVLADLREPRPDLVLVGGDVVAGPFPREVLGRLQDLGDRVRFIRGNADREVAAR